MFDQAALLPVQPLEHQRRPGRGAHRRVLTAASPGNDSTGNVGAGSPPPAVTGTSGYGGPFDDRLSCAVAAAHFGFACRTRSGQGWVSARGRGGPGGESSPDLLRVASLALVSSAWRRGVGAAGCWTRDGVFHLIACVPHRGTRNVSLTP